MSNRRTSHSELPHDSYVVLDPVVETGEEFVDAESETGVALPEECPICRYDLRGSTHSTECPECGADLPETVERLERRAQTRRELINHLSIFRWVVYCTIPIILWAPLAGWMYRSNEIILMWLILPTGILTAMGSAIYGSVQAGEEARDDGLGYVAVVCILLCSSNLAVLFYVMTKVASP